MTALLSTGENTLKECAFSVLVRREDQAKFFESKGIKSIIFRDLDDSETLQRAVSEHDGKYPPILIKGFSQQPRD